jgi:hypothetical protein
MTNEHEKGERRKGKGTASTTSQRTEKEFMPVKFCSIFKNECEFPLSFQTQDCLKCFGRKAIRRALKEWQ